MDTRFTKWGKIVENSSRNQRAHLKGKRGEGEKKKELRKEARATTIGGPGRMGVLLLERKRVREKAGRRLKHKRKGVEGGGHTLKKGSSGLPPREN